MQFKKLRLRFSRFSWFRFLRRSWVGVVMTATVFVIDHWSRIEFLIGKLRALPNAVADTWAWLALHQQSGRTSILLLGLVWIAVAAVRTAREASSDVNFRRSVAMDAMVLLGQLFVGMTKTFDELAQKAAMTVEERREWRDLVVEFKVVFPLASENLKKAKTAEDIRVALEPLDAILPKLKPFASQLSEIVTEALKSVSTLSAK